MSFRVDQSHEDVLCQMHNIARFSLVFVFRNSVCDPSYSPMRYINLALLLVAVPYNRSHASCLGAMNDPQAPSDGKTRHIPRMSLPLLGAIEILPCTRYLILGRALVEIARDHR